MKNKLDERQEQIMLKIEHNVCWIAYAGLLTAMIVQFMISDDFKVMAGEWLVFMTMCIYLVAACIRNGIWDRRFAADHKTNLLLSLLVAAVFGTLFTLNIRFHYQNTLPISLIAGVFSVAFVFVLLYVALTLSARLYRKRVETLEKEPEEEEENV